MVVIENDFSFLFGWKMLEKQVGENERAHGFADIYSESNAVPTKLMLIVSELAEALEADRRGNPPDEHIPEFSGVSSELADAVIRILGLSDAMGYDVGKAVVTKMKYNASRPYLHGNKAY